MRVEIPTYTDCWMKGDRYGEVVSIGTIRPFGKKAKSAGVATYNVQLDKSGKTIRFIADDCKEV